MGGRRKYKRVSEERKVKLKVQMNEAKGNGGEMEGRGGKVEKENDKRET